MGLIDVTGMPSTVLASAVPVAGWSLAGAVGWATFHLLGGPARSGSARDLIWAACLLVAVAGAALVAVTLARRYLVDDVARWGAAVGVGWGLANAAGWFLAVEVGGPATGMVTGLALAAAAARVPVASAAALGLAGLVGMVSARLVTGDVPVALGLTVSVGSGLAVVAVLRPAIAPRLPIRLVIVATVAFGSAWVGAWAMADALLSPVSASLSVAVEILAAAALGATAVGWELRSRTREPMWQVAVRWSVAAAVGVLGSGVLAATISIAHAGTSPVQFLDVATTIGLGVAAWFAVAPTLSRLTDLPSAVAHT